MWTTNNKSLSTSNKILFSDWTLSSHHLYTPNNSALKSCTVNLSSPKIQGVATHEALASASQTRLSLTLFAANNVFHHHDENISTTNCSQHNQAMLSWGFPLGQDVGLLAVQVFSVLRLNGLPYKETYDYQLVFPPKIIKICYNIFYCLNRN